MFTLVMFFFWGGLTDPHMPGFPLGVPCKQTNQGYKRHTHSVTQDKGRPQRGLLREAAWALRRMADILPG